MRRARKSRADGSDPVVRLAMDALRRIVRALRLSASQVDKSLGISVAQLFVLQNLAGGVTRSVNELADRVATDPSTVSTILRRLVAAGLVTRGRSTRDARRAAVTVTASGQALLARAPSVPQADLLAALEALPPARRHALAEDLAQVADRLGPARPHLFFERAGPD